MKNGGKNKCCVYNFVQYILHIHFKMMTFYDFNYLMMICKYIVRKNFIYPLFMESTLFQQKRSKVRSV